MNWKSRSQSALILLERIDSFRSANERRPLLLFMFKSLPDFNEIESREFLVAISSTLNTISKPPEKGVGHSDLEPQVDEVSVYNVIIRYYQVYNKKKEFWNTLHDRYRLRFDEENEDFLEESKVLIVRSIVFIDEVALELGIDVSKILNDNTNNEDEPKSKETSSDEKQELRSITENFSKTYVDAVLAAKATEISEILDNAKVAFDEAETLLRELKTKATNDIGEALSNKLEKVLNSSFNLLICFGGLSLASIATLVAYNMKTEDDFILRLPVVIPLLSISSIASILFLNERKNYLAILFRRSSADSLGVFLKSILNSETESELRKELIAKTFDSFLTLGRSPRKSKMSLPVQEIKEIMELLKAGKDIVA